MRKPIIWIVSIAGGAALIAAGAVTAVAVNSASLTAAPLATASPAASTSASPGASSPIPSPTSSVAGAPSASPSPSRSDDRGGSSGDDAVPDAASAQRAADAALAHVGSGSVVSVELSDDADHVYEVEIDLGGGEDIDVELDAQFVVVKAD